MYAKCIVLFCLLGLSALISAQSADQIRLNIRIFPSQVLSIATAQDSHPTNQVKNSSKTNTQKELVVSNLYGYQIKLLNEKHQNVTSTTPKIQEDDCKDESKLIYSRTSSAVNQKIPTTYFASAQKMLNKCLTSNTEKMLVYLIITQ